jgi:glycerate 2-kinase
VRSLRQELLVIFEAALAAVNGATVVRERLRRRSPGGPLHLVAIGKASCAMARGAHEVLGGRIRRALVVTKEGYAEPLPWPVLEAGHPYPDARSLEAGAQLLDFIAPIPEADEVLVLLSGGASALVEVLPDGVNLAQLDEVTRWLLGSGFDIAAMNAVRKRLSRIKGGRLAALLSPRRVTCFAISDVPGEDPRAIGSGPLTADPALQAPLHAALPAEITALLRACPPAPRPHDDCFENVRYEIVAGLDDALRAAQVAAHARGWRCDIHAQRLAGEAVECGARLARQLLAAEAGVVQVWGGESTVVLPRSPGRGGRNQSLALAAARVLRGHDDVVMLAAGSDGSDGPTDDAGALVDGQTVERGETAGLDADIALVGADAGTFLEASGDLIQTGPTGTNVTDLVFGLRARPERR